MSILTLCCGFDKRSYSVTDLDQVRFLKALLRKKMRNFKNFHLHKSCLKLVRSVFKCWKAMCRQPGPKSFTFNNGIVSVQGTYDLSPVKSECKKTQSLLNERKTKRVEIYIIEFIPTLWYRIKVADQIKRVGITQDFLGTT